jgi:hypothetical protein
MPHETLKKYFCFQYRFTSAAADNQLITTNDVISSNNQLIAGDVTGLVDETNEILTDEEQVEIVTDVIPSRDNLRRRRRPFSRYIYIDVIKGTVAPD